MNFIFVMVRFSLRSHRARQYEPEASPRLRPKGESATYSIYYSEDTLDMSMISANNKLASTLPLRVYLTYSFRLFI